MATYSGDGNLVSNTSDTRSLTANSISGGTASAQSVNAPAADAADGSDATYWRSAGNPPQWWSYDFGAGGAILGKFGVRHYSDASGNYIKNIYLSGSQTNTFSSYTALTAVTSSTYYLDEDGIQNNYARWQYWTFPNTQNYRYYRWNMVDQYYPGTDMLIWDFRAYEVDNAVAAYKLTLLVSANGGGAISSIPTVTVGGQIFDDGTIVSMTGYPNYGNGFVGWSGGLVSTANPTTVTVDAEKSVTASFTISAYTKRPASTNYLDALVHHLR